MRYDVFNNKYSKLMDKLNGYSISRFNDDSIVEEYFMVDKFDNKEVSYISVYMTDDEQFNVVVEVKNKYGEYEEVENKNYKTVNGAYKKIVQILG